MLSYFAIQYFPFLQTNIKHFQRATFCKMIHLYFAIYIIHVHFALYSSCAFCNTLQSHFIMQYICTHSKIRYKHIFQYSRCAFCLTIFAHFAIQYTCIVYNTVHAHFTTNKHAHFASCSSTQKSFLQSCHRSSNNCFARRLQYLAHNICPLREPIFLNFCKIALGAPWERS